VSTNARRGERSEKSFQNQQLRTLGKKRGVDGHQKAGARPDVRKTVSQTFLGNKNELRQKKPDYKG